MSIFKPCDIRGLYGDELTDDDAHAIGRAVATRCEGARVAVGGDGRRSTPALRDALTHGLLAAGADVVDLGTLPTPAFNYALREVVHCPGVMVTASHNPAEYNGFKVASHDGPTSPAEIAALQDVVESGNFAVGRGKLTSQLILPRYIDWLASTSLRLDGLHVALDGAGGCAGLVAPEVFSRLGAKVETVFCELDPDLSGRDPNPAARNALNVLASRVAEMEADLGVGYDGDGDRAVFVDGAGRVVPGDLAGTVLLKLVVGRRPRAAVVYDLKCSSVLADTARELDFAPHMERSGYAFIRSRMVKEDALFGCEASGHLFFGELGGCDDAMYASLGLAGVLARKSAPTFAAAVDELPVRAMTPDLRVDWASDATEITMEALANAHANRQLSRLDGVRVDFGDGWALARPSVTEPVVTLRFEAASTDRLEELIVEFLRPVPDLAEAVAELRAREGSD